MSFLLSSFVQACSHSDLAARLPAGAARSRSALASHDKGFSAWLLVVQAGHAPHQCLLHQGGDCLPTHALADPLRRPAELSSATSQKLSAFDAAAILQRRADGIGPVISCLVAVARLLSAIAQSAFGGGRPCQRVKHTSPSIVDSRNQSLPCFGCQCGRAAQLCCSSGAVQVMMRWSQCIKERLLSGGPTSIQTLHGFSAPDSCSLTHTLRCQCPSPGCSEFIIRMMQFRMGSHSLPLEKGRLARSDISQCLRHCKSCDA